MCNPPVADVEMRSEACRFTKENCKILRAETDNGGQSMDRQIGFEMCLDILADSSLPARTKTARCIYVVFLTCAVRAYQANAHGGNGRFCNLGIEIASLRLEIQRASGFLDQQISNEVSRLELKRCLLQQIRRKSL